MKKDLISLSENTTLASLHRCLVYNQYMAKRDTGMDKKRASRSKKTPKRLAIKKARLAALASKRKKK